MKKILVLSVLIAILMALATLSQAYFKGDDDGKGKGVGPGMIWRLDLTGEQKDKMTARDNEMRKEMDSLKKSLGDLRYQLNGELSSDEPNKARINELIDKTSAVMAEMQKKKIGFMLWMREQLTPEQKQKLKDLIQNREKAPQGAGPAGQGR